MKYRQFILILAFVLTCAAPAQAKTAAPAAPAPTADTTPAVIDKSASGVIKNFYAQLVTVMKQGSQLGYAGRYKKLDPTIRTSFDLAYMTRFAVGPVWGKATPKEQQALTSAFSDFSIATYASRFSAYDSEKFQVTSEKPAANGQIVVATTLTPKDSDPVALNYLMHADANGNWRIVDIFMNGTISELATRRSEFVSIANRDGIAALVNSLDAKSKQLGPS